LLICCIIRAFDNAEVLPFRIDNLIRTLQSD